MNRRAVMIIAAAALLGGCGTAAVPAPLETIDVQNLPEPQVNRPAIHRIESGETLIEIATNYGLDYKELAVWNGITETNEIYEGEQLRLTSPPAPPSASPVKQSKAPAVITTAPRTGVANLPVKDLPLAAKYAYTPETLAKLQKRNPPALPKKPAAETAADVANTTSAKPAAAESETTTETATAAGGKPEKILAQRRRFGVDWSWPSAGAVIEKFSESNKGINITGELGAAIYAGAAGKVVYVGTGVKSYGRLVIIKHANDYLSAYAHNQSIIVREGEQVKRGEQIATLGKSGTPSPMLHFEIRKAGKPFDPLRVLPRP